MDEFALLILLVLAIPVLSVAAFVVAMNQRSKVSHLLRRVADLEALVARLEAGGGSPMAAPAPAAKAAGTGPLAEKKPTADTPEPAMAHPEPSPQEAPPSVPPEETAPPPLRPSSGMEETLGTRVAVWVGGLALALGGLFLVRYSIEEGLLGPAARVALGGLFALALLVAGEWLRRGERISLVAGVPAAHVPGILTAAGTTSAFATVYAAYALYGFLSPAVAFIVLAVVAVGTMLAAALHGPVLAALGLLAATALPAMVSTGEPNAWGLFAHLAFVSAAAFGVARIRGWHWLAAASGLVAFGWGALYVSQIRDTDAVALAAFTAAMLVLIGLYHAGAPLREEDAGRVDRISTVVAGLFGLLAVAVAILEGHRPAALVLMVLLIGMEVALAAWKRRLSALIPVAAALAVLGVASFELSAWLLSDPTTAYPAPGQMPGIPMRIGDLFSTALALAGLIGGTGPALVWTRPGQPLWINGTRAGGAVAAPLALLAVVYWKAAALAPDLRFAGAAVALAGLFALLTERFARRETGYPTLTAATAALATGTVSAVGLALAIGLREGFLTVSLAILSLGIAWVHGSRPIRALPVLAMIVGGVVLVRTGLDPLMVSRDLGTTPIFNPLLWGYGLPAAAFAATAWLFGRQDAPRATALFEGLALLFTALLLALEIRHFTTGGRISGATVSLPEVGLQVMSGCLVAIAAQRLSLTRPGSVLRLGSMAIGALSLAGGAFGLLMAVNPMVTGDGIGAGLVFNDLLAGYLIPALAVAALAAHSRGRRPDLYVRGAGIVAGLIAFAWLTLEVRAVYHRPYLATGVTTPAEWYTYSIVWLVTGVVLLLAGVMTGSRELRLGSAALIVLTVLKVFLSDMADLEGVLRALSFMGLGLVLVGIGLLYQRLLFPKRLEA